MNVLSRALTEIVPAARVELTREDAGEVLVHLHGVPPEVGQAVADELQALMPMAIRVQVSTTREEPEPVYGMGPQALGRTERYEYADVTITIGGHRYDGLERVTYDGVPAPATAIKAAPKKAKVQRISRYEMISEDWLDVG